MRNIFLYIYYVFLYVCICAYVLQKKINGFAYDYISWVSVCVLPCESANYKLLTNSVLLYIKKINLNSTWHDNLPRFYFIWSGSACSDVTRPRILFLEPKDANTLTILPLAKHLKPNKTYTYTTRRTYRTER